MKHFRQLPRPYLVIVPKSTLQNWMNEFGKWCPSIKCVFLKGLAEERTALINTVIKTDDWDVLITSYECVLSEKAELKKHSWKYLIIDEAHRIKNDESKVS
jgi:SWI/SNF-related matrix-associated actin-dependent regulator of chromatin subfamily A member 5